MYRASVVERLFRMVEAALPLPGGETFPKCGPEAGSSDKRPARAGDMHMKLSANTVLVEEIVPCGQGSLAEVSRLLEYTCKAPVTGENRLSLLIHELDSLIADLMLAKRKKDVEEEEELDDEEEDEEDEDLEEDEDEEDDFDDEEEDDEDEFEEEFEDDDLEDDDDDIFYDDDEDE